MYRRAVMTFEYVKCDSLFDCQSSPSPCFLDNDCSPDVPPLNIVALLIMYPISLMTSPRWFHKISKRVPLM